MPAFRALPIAPYWSLEMFFDLDLDVGMVLVPQVDDLVHAVTVFQYWRVTLPFAGSQDAADDSPDESDDEHPASTRTLAAAVTTARRMRVTVLLIFSVPDNG